MALEPIDAFCDVCGTSFRATPTRSFLGFHKLRCPKCDAELTYPLSTGYRAFYTLASVVMAGGFVASVLLHHPSAPGLLGFAMIVAAVKDYRLRKELAESAEARRLSQTPIRTDRMLE